MPVMDGYMATKKIRSLEDSDLANIPIIALSANAFEEDRKAAWADYYKLCAAGGSMGYFDLLKYSGLHKVLDDGSVKIIMKGVFEELGL